MPNWCSNQITVRGSNQTEVQRLVDAFKRGEFCDAVIPVPEILKNPETTTNYGDPEKQAVADAIREAATKATGYQSWYDFCVNRWGTKWDVGDEHSIEMDEDGLGFRASFDSAWAPPIGVYEMLVDEGFEVTAYYYEPGMCFAGKWEDGIDDCYQDWGDSQGARDTLPQDLDELFNISESQAEYEEEERMEDDLYRWTKEGGEKLELKAE